MTMLHLWSARRAACLYFLCLLPAATAGADIYDCGGVLTNQACPGGMEVMEEKPYRTPTAQELERRKKTILLASLDTANSQAKRRNNVSVNTEVVRTLCDTGTLQDCIASVQQAEAELSRRITAANPTPNPTPPSQGDQNIGNQAITIVQNNTVRTRQRRYHRHYPVVRSEVAPPVLNVTPGPEARSIRGRR